MTVAKDLIEVWFRIEKDETGYPTSQDWEPIWCSPLENGYRVESIPFFVKGIAVGDLVSTKETEEVTYEFDRILVPGGHSTYRVWLSEEMEKKAEAIQEELRNLGCGVEITLGRLIAVDVPPDRAQAVRDYLFGGLKTKKWEIQEATPM